MTKIDEAIELVEELMFDMDLDRRANFFLPRLEDVLEKLQEIKYGPEKETTDDAMDLCTVSLADITEDWPEEVGTSSMG